jgi:hypothetical protein
VGAQCGSVGLFTIERLSVSDIPTLGEAGTWLHLGRDIVLRRKDGGIELLQCKHFTAA